MEMVNGSNGKWYGITVQWYGITNNYDGILVRRKEKVQSRKRNVPPKKKYFSTEFFCSSLKWDAQSAACFVFLRRREEDSMKHWAENEARQAMPIRRDGIRTPMLVFCGSPAFSTPVVQVLPHLFLRLKKFIESFSLH
ncbi:hypothetical protein CEXT_805321 [Caerostris extrusa]|uniref:Uncharacterized protein n=1 Tax=Caerostris extrusa TaxID=172846 RepID=A0AAV4U161_CAEEX|nr:hypothetical protein CEXT_805321 [Caerostris extrusa]